MSDPTDQWPMPRYEVPEPKYLHALGVISLNYNRYEHMLFAVFAHHLERTKMPGKFGEFLFSELNMQQRTEAIKKCFLAYEKDPLIMDAIDHLLLHFAWAFETRNILLHAHGHWSFTEEIGSKLPLAKSSKRALTKLNFMYLSLPHLRAIADSMWEGYYYLLNVWMYLRVRDDLLPSSIDPNMQSLLPHTLPQKPQIPKMIKLQDSPATGET